MILHASLELRMGGEIWPIERNLQRESVEFFVPFPILVLSLLLTLMDQELNQASDHLRKPLVLC